MSVFRYIAVDRGKLIDGHSAATEYSFDMPIAGLGTTVENKGRVQTSLSGKRYHTLHNIERSTSFTTTIIHRVQESQTVANIEEFLSSVAAGEAFEIDVYGSLASPGDFVNCVIDGQQSVEIVDAVYLQYSFKVVEI